MRKERNITVSLQLSVCSCYGSCWSYLAADLRMSYIPASAAEDLQQVYSPLLVVAWLASLESRGNLFEVLWNMLLEIVSIKAIRSSRFQNIFSMTCIIFGLLNNIRCNGTLCWPQPVSTEAHLIVSFTVSELFIRYFLMRLEAEREPRKHAMHSWTTPVTVLQVLEPADFMCWLHTNGHLSSTSSFQLK